jgi:hypothetical protein
VCGRGKGTKRAKGSESVGSESVGSESVGSESVGSERSLELGRKK